MATIIDNENVAKFREWYSTRGGVLSWTNLEIASGASREVFTPADAEKPNWRYGNPTPVAIEDVQVNSPTMLESFRGRFKAHYWGPGVAGATEKKANRLLDKYRRTPEDQSVYWTWVHADRPGYVEVRVYREALVPFTLTD